jgi:hypothetical protein
MNSTMKKALGILMLLCAVGVMMSFADDPTAVAYRNGYLAGYSAFNKGTTSRGRDDHAEREARNLYGNKPSGDQAQLKAMYKSGYIQGWEDKKADKPNAML